MIKVLSLGQAGFLFSTDAATILIDPYLSNSVAEAHGEEFNRLIAPPLHPDQLAGIGALLLTHAHEDHTDRQTLGPLRDHNPALMVIAPYESRAILEEMGFTNVHQPSETGITLPSGISIRAIPAAHTELERNPVGELRFVGYVLGVGGLAIYHAGDTQPHEEILAALADTAIDYAFLPVNERNYYRDRKEIIGNMSLREAWQFGENLGTRTVVPIHWEIFAPNRVYREEIELFYQLEKPAFELLVLACGESRLLGG